MLSDCSWADDEQLRIQMQFVPLIIKKENPMRLLTDHKMLRICWVCLLLSVSICSVRAQGPVVRGDKSVSPEKQALGRQLLELTNAKKTIETMLRTQADEMDKELPESSWKLISISKEVQSLTPGEREELRSKLLSGSSRPGQKMFESLLKEIDFGKLIEETSLPLYDKYFSETELKDLLAFYKSPTGRKVIETMPNLLSESIDLTAGVLIPKMTAIITRIQDEETERMENELSAFMKTRAKPLEPRRAPRKRSRH
jgi:hypothetical protein